MQQSIIFNSIISAINKKTYKKAREKEQELSKEKFTAYFLPRTIVLWFVCDLISGIITLLVLWAKTSVYLTAFFVVITFVVALISIHRLTYRCYINDEGLTSVNFGFIKKRVFWKCIYKIDVNKTKESIHYQEETNLIIMNKKNKIVYACPYSLVGAALIERKAKKERKKPH